MPAASFENLRALVVEDNAHMRALLRSLLHTLGIKNVLEASDGNSGFAELKAHLPDLVLTDLSMEPIDGISLTRQIRGGEGSPNPYVPIIMVTGHTERPRVEAARDAGVTEFLAKPITVHNLMARLAEIVDRPRPFVKCATYFGPDRRRRKTTDYAGPWRRHDDTADDIEVR
jgi:two-component system, chemotaxis family, chemotaxis protein CheY